MTLVVQYRHVTGQRHDTNYTVTLSFQTAPNVPSRMDTTEDSRIKSLSSLASPWLKRSIICQLRSNIIQKKSNMPILLLPQLRPLPTKVQAMKHMFIPGKHGNFNYSKKKFIKLLNIFVKYLKDVVRKGKKGKTLSVARN